MTLFSSDWLNPMLVRDLRQGLRSNRFTAVFLTLQAAMAFFVVIGLLSGPGTIAAALLRTLTMGMILFYLLGLPMAATFALSSEFLDRRIDLLKLTQMSARSLIWGKWFSLVTQGLMVFTSLLPYLILTYFFGGVDVPQTLLGVACLLALSAMLVAVCVALSCFNSMIFRILLVLGLLGVTTSLLMGAGGGLFSSLLASIQAEPGIAAWLYLVVGGPFLWLVMEFGAYFLSPAAENHDTPQRLILFGLIALAGGSMVLDLWFPGTFLDAFTDRYFFLAGLLALWVLMFAAAGEPSPYPDTYRPFVRCGAVGKFFGRVFLYPCWPSSAPFIMLATAFFSMLAVAWISLRGLRMDYFWLVAVFLLLPPALLFPQAVCGLLLRRSPFSSGARYFIILAVVFLIYVVSISIFHANNDPAYLLLACLFPPDALLLVAFHWLDAPTATFTPDMLPVQVAQLKHLILVHDIALILIGVTSAITMVVVCIRALRAWAGFTRLEQRASTGARQSPATRPVRVPAGGKPRGPTFKTPNPT